MKEYRKLHKDAIMDAQKRYREAHKNDEHLRKKRCEYSKKYYYKSKDSRPPKTDEQKTRGKKKRVPQKLLLCKNKTREGTSCQHFQSIREHRYFVIHQPYLSFLFLFFNYLMCLILKNKYIQII